ncbi:MAG: DUF427 domain-containing protein [Haloechinothrix sp.]
MTNDSGGRVRVEPSAKRVRAVFAGQVVADSNRPLLVWEKPYYPTYYLPQADVRTELIVPSGQTRHSASRGDGQLASLKVGDREATDAVLSYPDSPIEQLRDHVRLEWGAMDTWFEEDEEVYVHPRDPYKRVDILASSRRVRVEVDGVTIADSTSPRLLFETSLPTRYYLPKTDLRLELFEPSQTITHCPYKGAAQYYSVRIGDTVHPDVAWYYRTPIPESFTIAGLVAFYNEKVDLYVNEALQERPRSPFS